MQTGTRPCARIIIVNANSGEFIRDAIESALGQTVPAEVVVVDNCSTDGSPVWLGSMHNVNLIRRESNDGFGTAVNTGARGASAPFLALLNPDAVADPTWIDETTTWMNATGTDVAGTLVRGGEGYYFTRGIWVWWRGSAIDVTKLDDGPSDWINGCAMVIRTELFHRLGGFDERFFLYAEDVDLSLRARRLGARIGIYRKALVLHEKHGKSTDMLGFRKHEIAFESRGRLLALHTPWPIRPLACAAQGLLQPLIFPVAFGKKIRLSRAFFRGYTLARAKN